jgi:RNA polymerase sigma factor (sigma-70 family)
MTRGIATASRREVGAHSRSGLADHAVAAAPDIDYGALDAAELVRSAADGEGWAWERLVAKYSRLIWAITREFRLAENDAADVVQATWLRLFEHIHRIKYPDRIGSWLMTTARHECLRHLAAGKKVMQVDNDVAFDGVVAQQPDIDEGLLADERAQAVRHAVSLLPGRWQHLLELLMADPPVSYTEISSQLGLPVGSIGPTRGRCLERLRGLLQVP